MTCGGDGLGIAVTATFACVGFCAILGTSSLSCNLGRITVTSLGNILRISVTTPRTGISLYACCLTGRLSRYFGSVIVPEFVYTTIITIFLYLLLLKINQKLEAYEKRRAIKFDL